MKILHTITALGALGLGLTLAACSGNSDNVHLTPQPPSTPTPTNTAQPTGAFIQIERLSRPAIKEVFETFNEHKISNAAEPWNDSTIQNDIKSTEDALRPPTQAGDYGAVLQSVLYPDEYAVDLSKPTGGFLGVETGGKVGGAFGGRNINDDVIAVELSALFGNALPTLGLVGEDNLENNCLSAQNVTIASSQASTTTFPYLATPH